MLNRLFSNWVYGGFLAGLLLLVLSPLLLREWPCALAATFFCLPAYMIHQYEEHDDDRFRKFVNRTMGHGREVLSTPAVFVINIPGVWGVIALALWLGFRVHPGLALIAVYLLLGNAIAHVASAVATRGYNPGLVSGVVVFLPLSLWCLWLTQKSGAGTPAMHAIGMASALAIHAAIFIPVLLKRRRNV